MKADCDTICAGLLHDTLEDTDISKEEITILFNQDVAELVDGVTKLSKMNFSSKQACNLANTRKIVTSLRKDVRIILIKLADRLHNMRTLQFKSEFKQKENALETMEIFVPLAYYLGHYRIKSELEDISLYYLKRNDYKRVEEIKNKLEEEGTPCLEYMSNVIGKELSENTIYNEIKLRTKNIYGIYKKLEQGMKLSEIPDLWALKIMVNEIKDCYLALGLIHFKYHPVDGSFRDYLCNPKPNKYSSLHTTVMGEEGRLVQAQIRTFEQDRVASFGLASYWNINKNKARDAMQMELSDKYQFIKSLIEIDSSFSDNYEFVEQAKRELFTDRVYVYTPKGDTIELPLGATIIDFAYRIHSEIGNRMIGAIVNDEKVSLDYVLKDKDRVKVLTNDSILNPESNWVDMAKTAYARRKIKEVINEANRA